MVRQPKLLRVRQPKAAGVLDPVLGVTVHPTTVAAGSGVRE